MDLPWAAAAVFKASQNSGSRDKDVLCPAMVSERFNSLFTLMAVEGYFGLAFQRSGEPLLWFAASERGAIFCRLISRFFALLGLALEAEVDNVGHYEGPNIFSGRTMASKSAAEMPSFNASSRKVVPFLCAVLAILAALS